MNNAKFRFFSLGYQAFSVLSVFFVCLVLLWGHQQLKGETISKYKYSSCEVRSDQIEEEALIKNFLSHLLLSDDSPWYDYSIGNRFEKQATLYDTPYHMISSADEYVELLPDCCSVGGKIERGGSNLFVYQLKSVPNGLNDSVTLISWQPAMKRVDAEGNWVGVTLLDSKDKTASYWFDTWIDFCGERVIPPSEEYSIG